MKLSVRYGKSISTLRRHFELHLLAQGWQFSSFTIDGRRGVVQLLLSLFPSTPVQLCLFHQKASVRRYTTTHPKTPCGKEIRQLMAFLLH
jgi:transposase-like protein